MTLELLVGLILITAGIAVLVWDRPRPRRLLDARTFGAVGDGIADDTRAIQAAIDAMPEGGGVLHLPPGRYGLPKDEPQ